MEYKDKIIEEFLRQFKEKDCKDIKVDSLAENLGISKRTIYEIFSSKDEIIKQSLWSVQYKIKARSLMISKEEKNPLKKILRSCFELISTFSQINVARSESLKKHYPEIAEALIKDHISFMKQTMVEYISQAKQEELIFPEIEPDFLLLLLMSCERDPKKRIVSFMGRNYQIVRIFAAHLFTILRGVCTLKGIAVCDEYYKEILSKQDIV